MLTAAGYPAVSDSATVNKPAVVAILAVLMIYVAMVYGPIAAMLVEMFPAAIRYTSMSLPYHLGNGWFGGFLPTTSFAMVAATGDIFYGLWYPVVVAAATLVIGFFSSAKPATPISTHEDLQHFRRKCEKSGEARLPADEPAILSFIDGLQDYEAGSSPIAAAIPISSEHWREVQHRCAEKHGIMLIAEDEGRPMGWAFAHDQNAELFVAAPERRHGYLAEIFLMPQARGKGLGRALIAACEDWARGRRLTLLTIGVLAKNPAAIRAYEGVGYEPYIVTNAAVSLGGVVNRKQRRAQKDAGPASPPPEIQQIFAAAAQYHQAGRLAEAEQLYRRVLAIAPRHADSLHRLGLIAYQAGRPDFGGWTCCARRSRRTKGRAPSCPSQPGAGRAGAAGRGGGSPAAPLSGWNRTSRPP